MYRFQKSDCEHYLGRGGGYSVYYEGNKHMYKKKQNIHHNSQEQSTDRKNVA